MKVADEEVLLAACEWLEHGLTVFLCTIVQAIGSSPRPVGSMLAVSSAGGSVGSLSGGCVEDELLERIQAGRLSKPVQSVEYGVTAQENERLGLPCGGRLTVLVQRLSCEEQPERWLNPVLQAIGERRCVRRSVDLHSGATEVAAADRFQSLRLSSSCLEQSFGPRMRMLLIGAGQLSQTLAELALAMDYEVLVNDPRREQLRQWAGPALPLLDGMPDDAVAAHANDALSIVITLTHDPRIDDMALMEALAGPAFYVGALGSVRTTEQRLARLQALDITADQRARLHAPVGLDIGSKTPLEIAVSIMAQLTGLRRSEEKQR